MNYIILDLEWDNAYSKVKKGFANQIIQIGAVKLNNNFETIDRFEVLVKSAISKKLTKRFSELTGITNEDMLSGIPFKQAVEQYNNWVGDNTITVTWSNSDLYVIMENAKLFADGETLKIEKYVDLQRFVQAELNKKGLNLQNQIALSAAAEAYGISTKKFDLHTALDDSLVTARLLKKSYNENFNTYLKDATNPEFYKKLAFKNYYISKINDKNIDTAQLEFNCDKCGTKAKRLKKWSYKNHWFTSEFECKTCGERFFGRVMFKKTYSSIKVTRRILRKTEKVKANEQTV
ncbi:MAG: exonuclease domain-containing protein [Clostridia bacterium]|nr:exonuclease domain-containing protein [Clostridia bacterium]